MESYAYDTAVTAAMTGFLAIYYLVMLALLVVIIIAQWKIFVKAGLPGKHRSFLQYVLSF